MRCLVCHRQSRAPACLTCRAGIVSRAAWDGCPRCGVRGCTGCGRLGSLAELSSAFCFAGSTARLVVDAKRYQCATARVLLEHSLLREGARNILRIVQRQLPRRIVFAPLSIRRWLNFSWHPLEQLYQQLQGARSSGLISRDVRIEWGMAWRWRQQASIAGATRRSQVQSLMCEASALIQSETASKILIVDDVLTSGQTLLKLAEREHRRELAAKHAGSISAFVLFRTPVGDDQAGS